jgi:hypothetical protein
MSVHLSDEQLPSAPNVSIRAMPGCAIVWFLPYRRAEGLIEIPEGHTPQSVEAIVIHDATDFQLPQGTKVLVSRIKGEGVYFEIGGEEFCRIKGEGLYLVDDDWKAA